MHQTYFQMVQPINAVLLLKFNCTIHEYMQILIGNTLKTIFALSAALLLRDDQRKLHPLCYQPTCVWPETTNICVGAIDMSPKGPSCSNIVWLFSGRWCLGAGKEASFKSHLNPFMDHLKGQETRLSPSNVAVRPYSSCSFFIFGTSKFRPPYF